MTEWRKTKKYNPSGPGYPEAGEYYVLMSEAEEKIEALEAENTRIVAEAKQCHEQNDRLVSEHMLLRQSIRELEAEVARLCESNAALVRVEISQQKAIEAAEARLRAVGRLGDLQDDLTECCKLEIRGAAGDLLKNTRRELQSILADYREKPSENE